MNILDHYIIHVIGMYDEINSFVSYVKDAAENGSFKRLSGPICKGIIPQWQPKVSSKYMAGLGKAKAKVILFYHGY